MRRIGTGLILIIALSYILGGRLMAYEEARFETLIKEGPFELRTYEPYLLAEILITGDMEAAGSMAFRPLFNYIAGANRSQAKVAMTIPVSQEPRSEKISMTIPVSQERDQDQWAVSFMMPGEFTLETIPIPEDERVRIREVPSRQMATIRYSGFWSETNYEQHKRKLEAWIQEQNLEITGPAIWARFNGPMTPWFLRRNEVQIPVAPAQAPSNSVEEGQAVPGE